MIVHNLLCLNAQIIEDIQFSTNQEFLTRVLPNEEYPEFSGADVCIDDENYIWIAEGSGYLRYDGFRFEYIGEQNDSSVNQEVNLGTLVSLFMDDDRNIWSIKRHGIQIFNSLSLSQKNIMFSDLPNYDKGFMIKNIEQISKNKFLCVATSMEKEELGVIEYFSSSDSIAYLPISFTEDLGDVFYSIEKGIDNVLYLGTNNGIVKYSIESDPFSIESYTKISIECLKDKNLGIRAIEQVGPDTICISASDENGKKYLLVYNIATQDCNFFPSLKSKTPINLISYWDQLFLDSKKQLWHSSFGNPIMKYQIPDNFNWLTDSIRFENISVFKSDPESSTVHNNRYVRNISEDKTSNIWITTNLGLWKHEYDLKYLSKIKLPDPHSNSLVMRVVYDESRKLYWICTFKGILTYSNESKEFELLSDQNTSGNLPTMVYTITLDNNYNVWIGSESGLYTISRDIETKHFVSEKIDLGINSIRNAIGHFLNDNNGFYYFSVTFGKYFRLDPETRQVKKIFLDSNYIPFIGIFIDEHGSYWGKNENQFIERFEFIHEDDSTVYIQKTNQSIDLLVNDLKVVSDSTFLVNDGKNLFLFNKNNEEIKLNSHFDKSSKPYKLLELLVDNQNRPWVRSNGHLLFINSKTKNLVKVADHILDNPISYSHNLSLNNNEVLISGKGSFYILNTDEFNLESHTDSRISKIEVNGNSNFDITCINKNEYTVVDLSHKENTIEIFFAPYDLGNSNELKYQYKLEGLMDSWDYASDSHSERFTQLKPGNYYFKIRSSTNGGPWSDEEVNLNFRILSPWYWSSWSKFLYGLFLIGLTLLVFRFMINRKLLEKEAHRLSEINDFKNQLYTNITHEFRTPLTVILGVAKELKSDLSINGQTKTFDHSLHMIIRNGEQLLRLVNQMLDLAKAEHGNLELEMLQSDIIPYLSYITESFHSMAESKNIHLTFYSEIDKLIMDFDAEKILAILSNLISNAIKFTNNKGKVIVHAQMDESSDEKKLILKIKDNGIGMSPESRKHIFDRFYQIDGTGTRGNEGTGIGLALTKELIDLLNGEVEVKSEIEKGSEFVISLPINNKAPKDVNQIPVLKKQENDDPIIRHEVALQHQDTLSLPLALIVEDNHDVAQFIGQCLTGRYKVIKATNGEEGINLAIAEIPDIIISDVMMPIKDGFELCTTIKNDLRTSHIPVILLTAKTTEQDKLLGLSKGADAYLVKPFNKAELYIRIDKLIELRKQLLEKFSQRLVPLDALNKSDDPNAIFLSNAIDSIISNLENSNYNASYLARDLKMSDSSLYRKLKALTNKSTAVFIRSVRLQRAKELLQSTQKNISEVAFSVGFDNIAWFSRAFKEEFGYPPSDVRK